MCAAWLLFSSGCQPRKAKGNQPELFAGPGVQSMRTALIPSINTAASTAVSWGQLGSVAEEDAGQDEVKVPHELPKHAPLVLYDRHTQVLPTDPGAARLM